MRKKIISVFFVLALVLTFTGISAFAEEKPKLSVSSARANAGETVDITLSLSNNPGIISMLLNVDYNNEVLELLNAEDAGVLGTQLHSNDLKLNPYILYWSNGAAASDFSADGTIATLTFKIKENTQPAEYPITVSYDKDSDGIFNYDFKSVDFEIDNGKIIVPKLSDNTASAGNKQNNNSSTDKENNVSSEDKTDNISDEKTDNISVTVNGKPVIFPDQQPVIQNDRTLVPLRGVFEALGAEVEWNDETKTVKSVKGDINISLSIGSDKLYVNDKETVIDVPAQIINDRTMIPLRTVAESFECKTDWDAAAKNVIIICR